MRLLFEVEVERLDEDSYSIKTRSNGKETIYPRVETRKVCEELEMSVVSAFIWALGEFYGKEKGERHKPTRRVRAGS